MSADLTPALAMRGITKRFGGITALREANLDVRAGTVHALLGENGAGKTTIMRIAFGLIRADAGVVERRGRRTHYRSATDAVGDGIGMVHQHFSLVPTMTVAENVALGGRGLHKVALAIERVREIGEASGLVVDPRSRVADLSVSAQQKVEIVKAFAHGATLLILDEPTAVLAPRDADELLGHLRAFADAGNAVVFITHKLREALEIADEVTVLRRGATVFRGGAGDATEATLVEAMVGVSPPRRPRASARPATDIVLQLERVALTDARGATRLHEASLAVHAGEIVGVAGVEGNGQRELLRVLSGRVQPSSGRVQRPNAVGFVPEDRHRDALIMDFTLTENVALLGAGMRSGLVPWDAIEVAASEVIAEFDVRAPSPSVAVKTLSGGNQQRFVLGRELHESPRALVIENPSRGLDVRATAAVHDQLRAARDRGVAIVISATDIDELLELADRVVVCYGGIVHDVAANPSAIARAMVGADS